MNKLISILALCFFACSLFAQSYEYESQYIPPDVSKFVNTLTKQQKDQLNAIADEGKMVIEQYRAELTKLRADIQFFYKSQGDHSADLYPLYDQRAVLYSKIDRAKYNTKMRIDAVLTPEQQTELRSNLEIERQKREVKKMLIRFLHPSTHMKR